MLSTTYISSFVPLNTKQLACINICKRAEVDSGVLRQTTKTQIHKSWFQVALCILKQMLIFIMKLILIGCLKLVRHSRKNNIWWNTLRFHLWLPGVCFLSHLNGIFLGRNICFLLNLKEGRCLLNGQVVFSKTALACLCFLYENWQHGGFLIRTLTWKKMPFIQKPKSGRTLGSK